MQFQTSLPCTAEHSVGGVTSSMIHAPLRRHIIMQHSMSTGAVRMSAASALQTRGRRSSQRCSTESFSSPHSSRVRPRCRQHATLRAAAGGDQQQAGTGEITSPNSSNGSSSGSGRRRHVLVLGGTGRVGSSAAASLVQVGPAAGPACHQQWLSPSCMSATNRWMFQWAATAPDMSEPEARQSS
jgi:hypothetical protein